MASRKEIKETDKVVTIPVVDIGNLLNLSKVEFDLQDPKIIQIAENIGKSLHEHGFVYLSNHGIPQDTISNAFEASRKFFSLPKEIKLKCSKGAGDVSVDYHGYSHAGRENLEETENDVSEWKEIYDFFTKGEKPYPTEDAPNFAPTMKILENACRHLETKLLRLLALAVGLDDTDYFYDRCRNLEQPEKYGSGSLLRCLLYPPIPEDLKKTGTWIGCNEHEDWGVLTLLFQDLVGGLEVKTAQGDWVKATPIPGTIVCNTGSLLEIWTGGYFPATPHRVHVKPIKENERDENGELKIQTARQSIVFFLQPDDIATIETLKGGILPKDSVYQSVSAGAYFQRKSRVAYGQEE